MKMHWVAALVLMSVAGASAPIVSAADKVDLGKREYESNCMLCHGADGKGGAYVDFLKSTPPDLTQLAKKNGGVFPVERVYSIIDGRQPVKSHGTADMPIWGRDYQQKAGEYFVDVPYDPELFVRQRILSLVDYLNRMQSK